MGCDIHSFVEVKQNNKWNKIDKSLFPQGEGFTAEPFNWRSYSIFAFLAGVRNYDHCTPISELKGLPEDSEHLNSTIEDWMGSIVTLRKYLEDDDYHSKSYLTLKELLDFNYDQTFWNRRITKKTGPNSYTGAGIAEKGEGEIISYRDNLGKDFFRELTILKTLGNPENVRIVFWFDN